MKSAIQESSGAVDKTGKLSRPDAGSVIARSATSDWEPDGSTGFSYKSLFEDEQTGLNTMLMKVDAGCAAPSHGHDKLEQILVLEGDFYDEYRTYGPGDFIVRAPGALHTGGTKNGAIVLLVYSE
ncbi:MAG: hypothetical protein HON65_09075 [Rhodospirillales bacterium]|nr:hypothetical protein [Rhodospirillales bacterium]